MKTIIIQVTIINLHHLLQHDNGLVASKPGFHSCWYPYKSLRAKGRASGDNRSHVLVKVLPTLVGTSKPLNKGVNDIKFGRLFTITHYCQSDALSSSHESQLHYM